MEKEFQKYIDEEYVVFSANIDQKFHEKSEKYKKNPFMPSGWQQFTLETAKYNKHPNNEIMKDDKDPNGMAIMTGKINDIIVIDIDNIEHWENLLKENKKKEPKTVSVSSGSGGKHLYFKYTKDLEIVTSKDHFIDKTIDIDVKTNGGCVFAPPTKYYNKNFKKIVSYKWTRSIFDYEMMEVPSWLKKLLLKKHETDIGKKKTTKKKDKVDKKNDCNDEKINEIIQKVCDEKENVDIDSCDHCESTHISKLLNLLSSEYLNNYNEWTRVGFALHNSGDFLDEWDKWSKGSYKYIEGECDKLWNKMKYAEGGLTIKSLHHWAKLCNKEEYEKIKQDDCILRCVNKFKEYLPNKCDLKIKNISKNDKNCVITYKDTYCPIAEQNHPIGKTFSEIWNNGMMDHRCSDEKCVGKIYDKVACVDRPLLKNIFANYGNITINNYISYGDTPHEDIGDDIYFEYDDILEDKELNRLIIDSLNGTHYDVAGVLYYLFKNKFILCGDNNWYKYDNHIWIEYDDIELRKNISNCLYDKYKIVSKFYKKQSDNALKVKKINELALSLKKTQFKNNVMTEAVEYFTDNKFEKKLNQNRFLIGFNNGIYDLKKMEFRDGNPDDYINITVDYDFDPNATNDKLNEVIEQILPNENVRKYVLKIFGSCLSGEVKNQKFFCFSGSGSNGKSFIIDILKNTLGEYYGLLSVSNITQKRQPGEQATPQLAECVHKRVVVFSEPNKKDVLNVGIMKELSGNDTISARKLRKDPITFIPQFKMILLCNHLPYIDPDEDYSTWRRIRNIKFISTFLDDPDENDPYQFKKDESLAYEIINWRQAFMNLLLGYYELYTKEGLKDIDEVMQTTEEYKKEDNFYEEYIKESIEKNDDENIIWSELKKSFEGWYFSNYHKNPPKGKEIKKYFESKFFKKEEKPFTIDKKTYRGWCGYKLLYNDE